MVARVFAYQVVYVLLHYLHDWMPNRFTRMLGSVNESVYQQMFAATLLPLVMLVVYLVSPLVFVRIGSIAGEVVFANMALLATSASTFTIEAQILRAAPSLQFKAVVVALFVISLAQYHVFTQRLPWFDLFAQPPGWPEAGKRS